MKRVLLGIVVICGVLACQKEAGTLANAAAPAKAAWSYAGSTGPEHWGGLSSDYVLARTGKQQSPVDIVTTKALRKDLAPLEASYHDTTLEVLNNGHTVEDDYHEGGTLTVDGHAYDLAQFHFHSPSEHTLDGEHAPMEMHLVHKDAGGKLAVVGVMIREGDAHPELAKLWEHMPTAPGRTEAAEGIFVNASRLLPATLASYRYQGSLTTPPCSEGVAWFVLQEPIQASGDQIAAFKKVISANNRPTQPLGERAITASR